MLASRLHPKAARRARLADARRRGEAVGHGNGRCRPKPPRPKVTAAMLRRVTIRPDPNAHIRHMMQFKRLAELLWTRPFTVVTLDAPLLLTSDEPVVVGDAGGRHVAECSMTRRQRERRMADALVVGGEMRDLLHIFTTRNLNVAGAGQIVFPMDPTRALVLGERGGDGPATVVLGSRDAVEFADQLNEAVAGQAYEWVVAHPRHRDIATRALPEAGPLILVCDGDSDAAQQLAKAPFPRAPLRMTLGNMPTSRTDPPPA